MPWVQVPTSSRVQEVFEQVLAEPDFQTRTTPPIIAFFQRMLGAVQRFLARWLPDLREEHVRFLSWGLLFLVIALFGFMAWRWAAERSPRRRERARTAAGNLPRRDAAGWAKWARSEAVAGRLRESATGLYQAVILHLESRGSLRYGEWKTPGDNAIEASSDPGLKGPLRGFLRSFVAIAFGPVDPTPEALDALFVQAERLGCPT